jgi:hypothetical protein
MAGMGTLYPRARRLDIGLEGKVAEWLYPAGETVGNVSLKSRTKKQSPSGTYFWGVNSLYLSSEV